MSTKSGDVTKIQKIDFAKLGGPTYIGRPNGESARKSIRLDELERTPDIEFDIDIPENTYNINSSFFLGLFGDSIRKAGSQEAFKKRFHFVTHGREYQVIDRSIQRALLKEKALKI